MLSLEEAFDIELPDRLLRRRTFASIKSIAEALAEAGVKAEAA
jgi:acyl carrier protein